MTKLTHSEELLNTEVNDVSIVLTEFLNKLNDFSFQSSD